MHNDDTLYVITGPTASGKTSKAVALAKAIDAEIISADSRQIYRGMDLGTGKDIEEYDGVAYHLIDICDAGYKYNLFEYLRDYQSASHDIRSRGKRVILCGGTGLYVESVLKGIELPPVPEDRALRASLEGKSLWLAQSLPVKPLDVLRAKLNMQLILTGVPVIICMLFAAFMFTPLQFAAAFVSALTFVLLLALFDLFVGLKMPNLNWTSEITPIKQSGGVMIAMLGGFIYTVIYCALFFMVGYKLGAVQFLLAVAAINLILSVLIYLWLKKKGTAVFSAL